MDNEADRIVWMDCEMTGLEEDKHTIIEIAAVVTDGDLNVVAMGPDIVIHQDEETLSNMNGWCQRTFAKNGLTERIRASKVRMDEAEEQILAFLNDHVLEKIAQLAGNSVYNDRLFIRKYMPRVDAYLDDHLIDVDSIKLLSYRWYPPSMSRAPSKKMTHRALDDIKEAIEELKHYKLNVFRALTDSRQFSSGQFEVDKTKFERVERFVGIDCFMAGLELNDKTLVEIGVIVTDRKLNVLSGGLNIVIHQSEETLSKMDASCKEIFTRNGLIEEIRASTVGVAEAEKQILPFLLWYITAQKGHLAGNSIYLERFFFRKYMPKINEFFHHHMIDIDSISELCRRWYPLAIPTKAKTHRALDDIRASIAELKHYRANVFNCGLSTCSSLLLAVAAISTMDAKADRIVWMDCEMTGLEEDKHTIVEIAVIVTDAELNIVAEGPDIVIHHDEGTLSKMNDWCRETFSKNGLIHRIRASRVEMAEAEEQVLAFLNAHVLEKRAPLAGNSVYMDRLYMMKYMPRVHAYLHSHLIDVDSISELAWRWYPQTIARAPGKKMTHRALGDIKESIAELKYYREKAIRADCYSPAFVPPADFESKKKKFEKNDRIVWMDCKITGGELNILDTAVIVTDRKLNTVAEGPNIAIRLDEETLSRMNESCKEIFAKNAVSEKIEPSNLWLSEVEGQILGFLRNIVNMNKASLAGNTIYMERIFIRKFMPRVCSYLDHHIIDVDSISELARRWLPSAIDSAPKKKITNRALDDIKESIEELKHYRARVFQ